MPQRTCAARAGVAFAQFAPLAGDDGSFLWLRFAARPSMSCCREKGNRGIGNGLDAEGFWARTLVPGCLNRSRVPGLWSGSSARPGARARDRTRVASGLRSTDRCGGKTRLRSKLLKNNSNLAAARPRCGAASALDAEDVTCRGAWKRGCAADRFPFTSGFFPVPHRAFWFRRCHK